MNDNHPNNIDIKLLLTIIEEQKKTISMYKDMLLEFECGTGISDSKEPEPVYKKASMRIYRLSELGKVVGSR